MKKEVRKMDDVVYPDPEDDVVEPEVRRAAEKPEEVIYPDVKARKAKK